MSTLRHIPAWAIAICAAAGLACLLPVARAATDPPVASPLGGGEGVLLDPVPPPANARRHRAVFVCQQDGVPVYADRPCGTAAAERNLTIESPLQGAAASTTPPVPRASTRPRQSAGRPVIGNAPARETKCAAIRQQLDELNDRMRAGYSAREAARLWQRWRDTRERLRTARC